MNLSSPNDKPFESAESALENCNNISEGVLSDTLKVFLEVQLPTGKKAKSESFTLGVVRSDCDWVVMD